MILGVEFRIFACLGLGFNLRDLIHYSPTPVDHWRKLEHGNIGPSTALNYIMKTTKIEAVPQYKAFTAS